MAKVEAPRLEDEKYDPRASAHHARLILIGMMHMATNANGTETPIVGPEALSTMRQEYQEVAKGDNERNKHLHMYKPPYSPKVHSLIRFATDHVPGFKYPPEIKPHNTWMNSAGLAACAVLEIDPQTGERLDFSSSSFGPNGTVPVFVELGEEYNRIRFNPNISRALELEREQ